MTEINARRLRHSHSDASWSWKRAIEEAEFDSELICLNRLWTRAAILERR